MRALRRALLAGALVLACSQPTTTSVARLAGPSDLAIAADAAGTRYVLIADAARDELNALNITPDTRIFVRAPNPLFPLAVPTAPFPEHVVAGVNASGAPLSPLAFALSPSTAQVTVMSTGNLTQLGNIAVPDTTLALAAIPGSGATRLVLAVSQGNAGSLYTVDVPDTVVDDPSALATLKPALKVNLGRSQPQALAVSPADTNLVVVGDRVSGDDGLGRTGALAFVDLAAGTVTRVDVGGPLKQLSIDPTGTNVFGVLDPEACAGAKFCSGLVAASLGSRSQIPTAGVPPIDIPGTANGVAAGGAATLKGAAPAPILVAVTSLNGSVQFVDGARFARVSAASATATLSHLDPSGNSVAADEMTDPKELKVSTGVTRTETATVTFQGPLPGLKGVSGTVSGSSLLVTGQDFAALGVAVGDLVTFDNPPAACGAGDATVTAVAVGRLDVTGFDLTCLGPSAVFTVRGKDYVVAGSVSGLMGRATANAPFTFQGTPLTFEFSGPALSFTMQGGDPRRDASYVIALTDGVAPFVVPVEAASLPGPLAWDPVRGFFYIAYQQGNGIIELNPGAVENNNPTAGLTLFQ